MTVINKNKTTWTAVNLVILACTVKPINTVCKVIQPGANVNIWFNELLFKGLCSHFDLRLNMSLTSKSRFKSLELKSLFEQLL